MVSRCYDSSSKHVAFPKHVLLITRTRKLTNYAETRVVGRGIVFDARGLRFPYIAIKQVTRFTIEWASGICYHQKLGICKAHALLYLLQRSRCFDEFTKR